MSIVDPFPTPPALVLLYLRQLQILRSGDADAIAELGDPSTIAKPWLAAECPDNLRHHIWLWCDAVVTWVNANYVWRSTQLIPDCWPRHPHLANEVPVLACERFLANAHDGPELLEDWHRHTLPLFFERLAARLGETSCRTGRHIDWPAAARHETAIADDRTETRVNQFIADTRQPIQLRPANARS